ncbi:hypothetical protein [Mucilaginibacter polytrichastri]|uniref:Uncharacterized protein n=1 Tax=Mucilaginibacter polytrichastri TaxID=1302689 RepID=A0A1Q5ZZ11_9SPHI|nr:hypothetical protein [Mucilaginibacter polytrichastri]OKS86982.1 hypothetical protein RG47T_2440 [Mucilaginibacter polytrichastri]
MKITKEEYNSISKSVKTFSYNPTYSLRVNRVACTYEIFVNDMLVDFSFETGNSAGEQTAGFAQYILRSGKQKIRVRVYPKAIKPGELETALSPDADLSVRVVHFEFGKGKPADAPQVYVAKLPKLTDKLPYFEWTGEFIADVPYTLKGWSDGVDLSKEDHRALEKEVLEASERYKKAFEQKDVPTIANMIYNREKEVAQAYFFVSGKEGNYDHGWEKLEQETKNTTKMNPIAGYSMHFFGDGKVVSLLQNKGENRDFPAIYGETADQENFYGLLFYRPKAGAALEVIR